MYLLMSPSVKGIGVRGHTIAGSIGVVAQYWRYYRLLEWAKFDVETFTSGSRKATGNPTKAATEDEQKRIQARIDSLAANFHDLVAKSRGDRITDWATVKSADIFIGKDAVAIGLVDAVQSKQEAIAKAKSLSGSKLIFTRDEIKKMSAIDNVMNGGGLFHYTPAVGFSARAQELVDGVFAMWRGESVRFQYRAIGL
jgi:ClpP class serine protease